MWLVKTTSVNIRQQRVENVIKIRSNDSEALFDGKLFRWEIFERLMEKGVLLKVEIHFYPSGRKKIKKVGGLYYLYIEDILVSRGYEERREAWNLRK